MFFDKIFIIIIIIIIIIRGSIVKKHTKIVLSFCLFVFHWQFVDYLLQTPLVVEVWGKQSGRKISRKETGGGKNNPVPLQRNSVGHEVQNSMSNGSIMVKDNNVLVTF